MLLTPTEEQVLIKDTVARLLRDNTDSALQGSPAVSADIWAGLAEIGIPAWLLPERGGGMGGGNREIIQLSRQLGYALCVTPISESIFGAGYILGEVGSDAQIKHWGEGLLAGTHHIALAATDAPWGPSATFRGGEWLLAGHIRYVRWLDMADAVLLVARDGPEFRALVIARDMLPAPELRQLTDLSVIGSVCLDGVAVPSASLIDADSSVIVAAIDRTRLGYAAHLAGLCDRVFEDARDYAAERRQFKVPIASFQVIQHYLARMFVNCELVQSRVLRSGLPGFGQDEDGPGGPEACLKYVGRKALQIAQSGTQIFGGMGITDELPVGRAHRQILALKATHLPSPLRPLAGCAAGRSH